MWFIVMLNMGVLFEKNRLCATKPQRKYNILLNNWKSSPDIELLEIWAAFPCTFPNDFHGGGRHVCPHEALFMEGTAHRSASLYLYVHTSIIYRRPCNRRQSFTWLWPWFQKTQHGSYVGVSKAIAHIFNCKKLKNNKTDLSISQEYYI